MSTTPRTESFLHGQLPCSTLEIELIDFVRQIETELNEAKARYKWKPIETAPKDGSAILVLKHRFIVVQVRWCKSVEEWQSVTSGEFVYSITHWMPCPYLPTPLIKDKRQGTLPL